MLQKDVRLLWIGVWEISSLQQELPKRQGRWGNKAHCGAGENDHDPGVVMLIRIPVAGTEAKVPTLAAVQWRKPNCNGYHAGLKFVMA